MTEPSAFRKLVDAAKKRVRECTIDDVLARRARGEKFHLVDVREDDEWRAGRAAGAVHIGKGVIDRDIEEEIPDKSAPIVLYCGGGSRSALAAETLGKMGYTDVVSMDGGIRGWRDRNLPEDRD
jgi:rhodanese-related sulfurtransferase